MADLVRSASFAPAAYNRCDPSGCQIVRLSRVSLRHVLSPIFT